MNFQPDYLSLGSAFFEKSDTAAFDCPTVLLWNADLAKDFGLTEINDEQKAAIFSGQSEQTRNRYALAYAGHQFGHFNPMLGDGRAHLLAEVFDAQRNKWELQMKGSGPTPFSRGGDGLCALGPAIREFIMSEAMVQLGVPSCRSLCVVGTGETVFRQHPDYQKTAQPGAVVTRAAASHIRVGTYQYFAARGDIDSLKKLTDFTIKRHYPAIASLNPTEKYAELLNHYIDKQIRLICEWMRVGFIHGVMNTDNVTLSGQTIDYGPCAMLESYDPNAVFSSIDQGHRYAFSAQANIAQWNMTRFAECLLHIMIEGEEIKEAAELLGTVLSEFDGRFEKAYTKMHHAKFGLTQVTKTSRTFIQQWLNCMQKNQLDYTNTFNDLKQHLSSSTNSRLNPELVDIIGQAQLTERFDVELMAKSNPVIIPRNHLVETAIEESVFNHNFEFCLNLIDALKNPYDESHLDTVFSSPSVTKDRNYQTFCGT